MDRLRDAALSAATQLQSSDTADYAEKAVKVSSPHLISHLHGCDFHFTPGSCDSHLIGF
jgi:hypothetical protein